MAAAALALLTLLLFPIYWMLVSSLTPESRLFQSPPLVPAALSLEHYRALFDERNFLIPIRNSLIVAVADDGSWRCPLPRCVRYALARLRFRGRGLLLALILAVSMFPQISIVPPLYLLLRELRLLDTYPGLVLPVHHVLGAAGGVAAHRVLPAASIGPRRCGHARRRVAAAGAAGCVLPLAAPGVATAAILTFLYCWNEFLFALSFTLGPDRYTVPVAVTLFRGRYQVPWGQVLAATVVATLPVALLVLAFQRRIVAGLTAGGSKG